MPWWILSMFIILGKILYKTVLWIHITLMRIRIRILLVTLMRIRILLFTSMNIRIWIVASVTLKSAQIGSYSMHFGLSSICKFMRIRIKLITFIRIQLSLWSGSYLSIWCGTCSKTLDRDIFNTDKYNFAILFFQREYQRSKVVHLSWREAQSSPQVFGLSEQDGTGLPQWMNLLFRRIILSNSVIVRSFQICSFIKINFNMVISRLFAQLDG